ncbi:MAG: PSD1 and planctomycete cytochrome C domain-containing protein [Planctomycetes bacterium]|nr:PSD1 and planctomycete cytochrome C domain-containing protein [Planctomycetota bacterium]MCH9727465.1 PSD1 and planctomycete cytochrome C domain-containing protein [Planctomycetota bacterium]MCH9775970.1 PSD1 and planctomycete cytochrome C domain-containing protein [Planctomycetota bacterium]MCH9793421.1 PSD1 and planctomycete cytochrome C domain-containing protein [Planctomycetota bacterium]
MCWLLFPSTTDAEESTFEKQVVPILQKHCIECHNDSTRDGGLSLENHKGLHAGGENGRVLVAGAPQESLLLDYVIGPEPEMPKKGKPLTKAEVETLRQWIKEGATWPTGFQIREAQLSQTDWWSFQPLKQPVVPQFSVADTKLIRTPIDAFLLAQLRKNGLSFSPLADRRTLIRRLYFDLIGLPPTPTEISKFVNDPNPRAYEGLVDRLLASPRYGERWARHWLDVVHYADTHGYDKDKLRENAWPYRDYVIRAFNEDKPYSQFIQEQIAGDILHPYSPDGVPATGFIVAGPFDWVGQIEINEKLIEKKITRNLDRDDMVATVMNSTVSLTVQCARCHNHKFDPIAQEDYYGLQAVFAGIDRADRDYEPNAKSATRRKSLMASQKNYLQQKQALEAKIRERGGKSLVELEEQIAEALNAKKGQGVEYGYHSHIEKSDKTNKWVQLNFKQPITADRITLMAAYDDYNKIGAGFGFPKRFKLEISDTADFATTKNIIADHTGADFPNPQTRLVHFDLKGQRFQYLRMTATQLAPRSNDFIFALGEIKVLDSRGENLSSQSVVTSLDSIEAPPRWSRKNVIDGKFYYSADSNHNLAQLKSKRDQLVASFSSAEEKQSLKTLSAELSQIKQKLDQLPPLQKVFAAATHFKGRGNFKSTLGKPRPVFLLSRGSEKSPVKEVKPTAPKMISALSGVMQLENLNNEGARRIALARWITNRDNPLTWRSIVNRVWQYHFGKALVDTPNDFGKMGALPSHPELLDYLASRFRDEGQSLKTLHRMLVLSTAYQQSSLSHSERNQIDGDNRLLWRMNRRKLEAEAIRDSVLQVSGKLDLTMYGPGDRLFVLEKPQHSPHYLYQKFDPASAEKHRRSIYRFIVRSVPDPFMETLDCADPSQMTPKRLETLTALQALSLMNDHFMVSMSTFYAQKVKAESSDLSTQIKLAFETTLGRPPKQSELEILQNIGSRYGIENVCRLIFNSNEFIFID